MSAPTNCNPAYHGLIAERANVEDPQIFVELSD
jgi:hypothetical protein